MKTKYSCDDLENRTKMWDKRFSNGDLIMNYNYTWKFYISSTSAYGCSDISVQLVPGEPRLLSHCSSSVYTKLGNIFDLGLPEEEVKRIETILTGEDLEGKKFIFEYLINEQKKREEQEVV